MSSFHVVDWVTRQGVVEHPPMVFLVTIVQLDRISCLAEKNPPTFPNIWKRMPKRIFQLGIVAESVRKGID